ncbi:basic amino acid ABC transporter substrate-binding protein [Halanaerobaculum tunisiense]
MKKIILFSLLIAMLVVAGCGQQETTWSQVQDKGELVVGLSADYKPFEFPNEDNQIVGFDVDILKAVADELGVELKIKDTAFDGLIPGLKTDKYDAVASAMTITEKRQKAVNFSDPYFDVGQVIAVTEDEDQIQQPEDLAGKTVAVQLGTTGDLEVSKMEDEIKEIKRYEKITQAYIELKNGRIDAVVNDKPVTKAYIDQNPEVKMADEPFTTEKYGIAFKKGDDKLLEKANQALQKIKENGTYDEIYDKWFK